MTGFSCKSPHSARRAIQAFNSPEDERFGKWKKLVVLVVLQQTGGGGCCPSLAAAMNVGLRCRRGRARSLGTGLLRQHPLLLVAERFPFVVFPVALYPGAHACTRLRPLGFLSLLFLTAERLCALPAEEEAVPSASRAPARSLSSPLQGGAESTSLRLLSSFRQPEEVLGKSRQPPGEQTWELLAEPPAVLLPREGEMRHGRLLPAGFFTTLTEKLSATGQRVLFALWFSLIWRWWHFCHTCFPPLSPSTGDSSSSSLRWA